MGPNFWAHAEAHPDAVALIEPDGQVTRAGDLLASVNQLVHGLRGLGLQPGDGVAAMLPNSREAMELVLAVQQAGWYLTPINYHSVGPEIDYIVRDCEAKVFVGHELFGEACLAGAADAIAFGVGNVPGFRPFAELKDGRPESAPASRLVGRTMNYTSGTTGRPKGVRRPLPGVDPDEYDWVAPLEPYRVYPGDPGVHLLACPWYHTAPLVMVNPSMHLGHAVVIVDRWDAERTLELIARHKVTITHLVPTQFVRLLALPEDVRGCYDVSSLEHVIHGAAPCSHEVKRRMIEWWGPVLDEYYASTEAGGTIAFSDEWLRKPGTVGLSRTGAELAILDEDGQRLPAGEVGTIYIKPTLGPFEYFKDAAKTGRSRWGEYVTVGDMGYLDEDGYLFLCDRATDMIISGGVNIYPAEVEGVLVAHPKVADVAVFGIPNDEWGEEVKAVVQPAPGVSGGDVLATELLAYCQERLAKYKLPRSFDFTDEMPRDPNGKLYKRKLREPYWAGRQRAI